MKNFITIAAVTMLISACGGSGKSSTTQGGSCSAIASQSPTQVCYYPGTWQVTYGPKGPGKKYCKPYTAAQKQCYSKKPKGY